ncbi:NAD-dependent epimerase/dehydratase family protein, partial [Streptomyces sp. NPDC059814]|uniref:NAD-dependent epimerase/dehydratase family protein n=1 Tax=Streptomyces sp. NPDC059814 TaxID=3346959 RepID=UPI00364974C7
MRVLVTGGAGFIGSEIVRTLTSAGHEAVVLDALLPSAHGEGADRRADSRLIVAVVRGPAAGDRARGGRAPQCPHA